MILIFYHLLCEIARGITEKYDIFLDFSKCFITNEIFGSHGHIFAELLKYLQFSKNLLQKSLNSYIIYAVGNWLSKNSIPKQ